MGALRQYILSVISIAILCAIVQQLLAGNHHIGIVKIITGLVVTVTVLNPLLRMDGISLDAYFDQITANGELAVIEGENAAANATAEIIRDRTAAYICDKASTLGASITVDVELEKGSPPIPSRVKVRGNLSPYVKRQLSTYMQTELGISEEQQLWIS